MFTSPWPLCHADLSRDGAVNVNDLLILLGAWGECSGPDVSAADLNHDGTVIVSNFLMLLEAWGPCPR